MKKHNVWMAICALLVAALVLTACGQAATPAPAAKVVRVAVVMPSSTTDMAFSQSMYSALVAVQKEMGGEAAMEIKYSENMFKVPDAAAAIRDYASRGLGLPDNASYRRYAELGATEILAAPVAWGDQRSSITARTREFLAAIAAEATGR